jgi:hypothetical protein
MGPAVLLTKTRLKEKLAKLEEEVKRLVAIEKALLASPDKQISLTDPDCRWQRAGAAQAWSPTMCKVRSTPRTI